MLVTVRDLSIRPTTDRAKQTIFDILTHRIEFEDAEVLDLFAGSGSLGLEAISRGARSVTFVDKSRTSLAVLEQNVRTLRCETQCSIHQAEVFWFLKNTRRTFDIVFVDPPYRLDSIGKLPTAIYESGVLRPHSYVVMEHNKGSLIQISDEQYEALRKPFGQTIVLIMKPISLSQVSHVNLQKESA